MASKKKPENNEPKISNIPMPISDNPLVVDLPDGQKLILGKLTPGHVIEVATWRGTGRPDSRTNRLMLGMTDGLEPVAESGESQDSNTGDKSSRKIKLPFKVKVPTGALANSFKFVFTNVSSHSSNLSRYASTVIICETMGSSAILNWKSFCLNYFILSRKYFIF
jgi:hypothetical protein